MTDAVFTNHVLLNIRRSRIRDIWSKRCSWIPTHQSMVVLQQDFKGQCEVCYSLTPEDRSVISQRGFAHCHDDTAQFPRIFHARPKINFESCWPYADGEQSLLTCLFYGPVLSNPSLHRMLLWWDQLVISPLLAPKLSFSIYWR